MKLETKPEPWPAHPVKQAPESAPAHRPSPEIQPPEPWKSRRLSQSPPPSNPPPIRVYPCPSVASSISSQTGAKISPIDPELWPRMATDAHGFQSIRNSPRRQRDAAGRSQLWAQEHTLPFHLRPLKIDEQGHPQT